MKSLINYIIEARDIPKDLIKGLDENETLALLADVANEFYKKYDNVELRRASRYMQYNQEPLEWYSEEMSNDLRAMVNDWLSANNHKDLLLNDKQGVSDIYMNMQAKRK